MNVSIKIIPHKKQQYETVGDWTVKKNGDLDIFVSSMDDWRKEMLVAYHELREYLECKHKGITQKEVDDFDKAYEKKRKKGDTSEPGNDPHALYFTPHHNATRDERLLAADLGVEWCEYEATINAL